MNRLDTLTPSSPLVLIGVGKMGGALLSGWLASGLDPRAVVVVDPSPPADSLALLAGAGIAARKEAPATVARVIVVAVKPQVTAVVLPGLKPLLAPDTIVVSIVAGKTIGHFEAALGEVAIVRAMPNTPAEVGRGITAAVANPRLTAEGRALVTALLAAVGEVAWLDEEAMIDAVTAVSGSGPAYVFYFTECLAEAARQAGLPDDLAARFARATVAGAGELLHRSELSPSELRRNVTSPAGTTAAALAVLMADDGLRPLVAKAVAAAKRRSEELSG
jgi:pyrroline-5-carboxylate reductase